MAALICSGGLCVRRRPSRLVSVGGGLIALLSSPALGQTVDHAPEDPDAEAHETVVTARRPQHEPLRRSVEAREATRVAGSGGDPIGAVLALPGLGRSRALAGDLLVRGAAPSDSQVFIDGVPVPLLYHFGGLVSVISDQLLERIDFLPGNFSVRIGRRMGGVVEVTTRAPAGLHLTLDADLLDVGGLVEVPLGRAGAIALAARRSFVDRTLDAMLPAGDSRFSTAPVYWDVQLAHEVRLGSHATVRTMLLGSGDALALRLAGPSGRDPGLRGGLERVSRFHRAVVHLKQHRDGLTHELTLSAGTTVLRETAGLELDASTSETSFLVQDEVSVVLQRDLQIAVGLDLDATFVSRSGTASSSLLDGEPPQRLAQAVGVAANDERLVLRPALYVEARMRPSRRFELVTGARLDGYGDIDAASIDPRASARLALAEAATLHAGAGVYSQPPSFEQSSPDLGARGLGPASAFHLALGIEQGIGTDLRLDVTGFAKILSHLVVRRPSSDPQGFVLVDEGEGRVVGAEIQLRHRPTEHLFGWIAYTILRSDRRDPSRDVAFHPSSFDQTHLLTVVAGLSLPGGWHLGTQFRLSSGAPETPIHGASHYDADTDTFVPETGPRNSARLPASYQLDLRLEREWRLPACSFAAYVEVLNVTNHQNVEGHLYSYDYRERVAVLGLPILPSVGVRGAF